MALETPKKFIRKHTDVRRRQIVDAARKIIVKYGSENITLKHLAKEVGISQAAIYRHFKSKEELLLLLIDSIEENLLQEMTSETGNRPPLEVLENALRKHILSVRRRYGVFFPVVAEVVSLGDKKLNKRVLSTLSKYTYSIKNLIEEAVQSGDIRADIDTERTAMLLLGAVQGLVNMWTLKNRGVDLELEFSSLWDTFKESIEKVPKSTGALEETFIGVAR